MCTASRTRLGTCVHESGAVFAADLGTSSLLLGLRRAVSLLRIALGRVSLLWVSWLRISLIW